MKNKIIFALMLVSSITQAQVTVDWSSFPGGGWALQQIY